MSPRYNHISHLLMMTEEIHFSSRVLLILAVSLCFQVSLEQLQSWKQQSKIHCKIHTVPLPFLSYNIQSFSFNLVGNWTFQFSRWGDFICFLDICIKKKFPSLNLKMAANHCCPRTQIKLVPYAWVGAKMILRTEVR